MAPTRGEAHDGHSQQAAREPREETFGARRRAAATPTQHGVLDEVFSLRGDEPDRMVHALARLELSDADAIVDQIAALRLAHGVIRLHPTEAEPAAVEAALVALAAKGRLVGPALHRLASVCAGSHHDQGCR